jgi:hypothetical protein
VEIELDLYLHIGTEKTGTTSVQKFMDIHRDRFREIGILYPRAPGRANHLGIPGLAQAPAGELRAKLNIRSDQDQAIFREKLKRDLGLELKSGIFHKVVMSSEHCSSRLRSDEEVGVLREFLREFFDSIYIVAYLRRQDEFLLSTYSTQIKCGRTKRLHVPDSDSMRDRYDYWELLSRWARAFGRERVVCRRYQKNLLANGNIIDDFLITTGIGQSGNLERPPHLNESLDADCLEFLRLMNKHLDESFRLRKLVRLLEEISAGPLLSLPDHMLDQFMRSLRESNRRVASEYFGGEILGSADPLFGARTDDRPRTSEQKIEPRRMVEITAKVLDRWARDKKHRSTGRDFGVRKRPQNAQDELSDIAIADVDLVEVAR